MSEEGGAGGPGEGVAHLGAGRAKIWRPWSWANPGNEILKKRFSLLRLQAAKLPSGIACDTPELQSCGFPAKTGRHLQQMEWVWFFGTSKLRPYTDFPSHSVTNDSRSAAFTGDRAAAFFFFSFSSFAPSERN